MRKLVIFCLFSSYNFTNISIEDIDLLRISADKDSQSIISNGTSFCNDYFSKKTGLMRIDNNEFKNIFLCKFSKKEIDFMYTCCQFKKLDSYLLKISV